MSSERSHRLSSEANHIPVSAVMARPVVTVDPDMGLMELMRLLLTAGIGGAPVVDASGTPIGVVTKTDLLRELYDRAGSDTRLHGATAREGESLDGGEDEEGEPLPLARDMMSPNPLVVAKEASLAHAAVVMADAHLHRVFVVEPDGAIAGVLASSDVVNWLARSDAGIVA